MESVREWERKRVFIHELRGSEMVSVLVLCFVDDLPVILAGSSPV